MQHLKRTIFLALLATIGIFTTGAAQADLSFFKRGGVMKISGKAVAADVTKLKEQLTPDIKTIVLYAPSNGSWTDIREMTDLIEKAEVTTVAHGTCSTLICSALFLSGKQRLFSGALRPEANSVRVAIGEGHFPQENESKGTKWNEVMDWYRGHSNLGYSNTKYLHKDFIRAPGVLPVEAKVFFPVSAKTSKGNTIHCWGNKQNLHEDCEAVSDLDALKAGIVTSADLFLNAEELKEVSDIAPPAPTSFAKLEDAPPSPASDACRDRYKDFLRYDSPRAFVITSNGGCYFNSAQTATPYRTPIERCKKERSTAECRFYAVDDKVVFTPFDQSLPEAVSGKTASN
ncbi:hypothetical protein GCM10027046_19300 [Uliginosibacterium flavum]|uniref:Uncharacterized protein n=1 Tax=Uliginosibacterium flavum TaxID=1396831 RepID=A0ABV2TFQ6_9RHOO